MRKVSGSQYLYQRGNRYLVRMQVPSHLRQAVGKHELLRSLGPDPAKARRDSFRVIAEFQQILQQSDVRQQPTGSMATTAMDRQTVDEAVRSHFLRSKALMRGGSVAEAEHGPSGSRQARITGFEQHIELLLTAFDHEDFSMMITPAEWFCHEHGWTLTPELFDHLCVRLAGARLTSYRAEVRRLRGDFSEQSDVDPLFGSSPVRRNAVSTLGALIDKFVKERESDWSVSTRKNYVIITRVLEELCGRDTRLADVDRTFCRGVRDLLKQLPSNYQKKSETKGRSLEQVIEIAAASNMPLLKPATINAHINKLGAIIRFGRDEGWIVGNPIAGLEVLDPVDPLDKRAPFTAAQLTSIFSAEPWSSHNHSMIDKPSRYWGPLIGLFSGARLGEIAGTRLDEIIEKDGTHLLEIKHRPDRPVKGGRGRLVPIHSTLIALGFLDFVAGQRLSGTHLLFPEEKANSLNQWGDALSGWFSRLLAKRRVTGQALSFHSFRHTFEDALREADLHDTPLGNALTGRRSSSVSGKVYGSKFSTTKLSAAIERVRYAGFPTDHLLPEPHRSRP